VGRPGRALSWPAGPLHRARRPFLPGWSTKDGLPKIPLRMLFTAVTVEYGTEHRYQGVTVRTWTARQLRQSLPALPAALPMDRIQSSYCGMCESSNHGPGRWRY
jgi:hypothetical protein